MKRQPGAAGADFLAHGMGKALVEPDWPPLTDDEVSAVLARYGLPGTAVRWRSPRPMSAAALVRSRAEQVFVKRHHTLVRSAGQLAAEHTLADHLRALGVAVPAVLRLPDGGTTVTSGDCVYEVHALAGGADLYRECRPGHRSPARTTRGRRARRWPGSTGPARVSGCRNARWRSSPAPAR